MSQDTPEDAPDQTPDAMSQNPAAGSDGPAWRPFVDGLRAFIGRRVPEASNEDVLQETLVRLHESADTLRDADRIESWVFTIARRTIADFYRQRDRQPPEEPLDAADGVPREASFTEEEAGADYDGPHDVHEEVLSWLRPFAKQLDEMYRRPLLMADFQGYTQKEVADELGLSLSGAKSRIQRARAKVGARLKQCCDVEFGPDGRARAFRRRKREE
jgi:RNA polymerase sigma-70 factor (ECF subfamily)